MERLVRRGINRGQTCLSTPPRDPSLRPMSYSFTTSEPRSDASQEGGGSYIGPTIRRMRRPKAAQTRHPPLTRGQMTSFGAGRAEPGQAGPPKCWTKCWATVARLPRATS